MKMNKPCSVPVEPHGREKVRVASARHGRGVDTHGGAPREKTECMGEVTWNKGLGG